MISEKTYYGIVALFLLLMFSETACINIEDRRKANNLQTDTVYPERATGVILTVTDSGHKIAEIRTPLMERYSGKNPYIEMTKGLKGLFFNKNGVKENQLDADYGISKQNEKIIEVRRNVILENVKGEKLNSEKLVWNQATQKIYTDEFVKITTPDEVIYGDGFESNQNFTEYRIFKIKGILSLKDVIDSTAQNDSAKNN
jgi:LPS export ABC transporter protein LptC